MQFSIYAATCLALVSRASAQTPGFNAITAPTKDQTLTAGTTSTVTWDYNPKYAGTVSISLLQGATPETLQVGGAIATGIDNSAGSYTWSIASSLGADATYGLKITLDSDPSTFQYSFPFHIASSSSSSGPTSSSSGSGSVSSDSSDSAPVSSSVGSASGLPTSISPPLSSQPSVPPTVSTTSAPTTFATLLPTSGSGVNSTSSATGTTLTSQATPTGTGSGTSSSSPPVATAGAVKVVAGSFAAMGGLAAALLAF
ncbi:anchored cell wall protein-7 [Diaporthe helianthi]|uniref:Anchored cell wall protein-7 n=1 Tax=Diaporthe helianthi TaxID=158607 RepID=A0A2P5IE07_DIAHE|nr:anchored cell wall protein-7 [Diaporthe helianthi]